MTLSIPTIHPDLWRRPTVLTKNERPAMIAIAAKLVIIIICIYSGWITYDGYMNTFAIIIASAWALSIIFLIMNFKVLGNLVRLTCMLLTMSLAAPLATAALAKVSAPLADNTLMRLDGAVLGAPAWPSVLHLFEGYGSVLWLLSYAYVSLGWQLTGLVLLLCVLEMETDAWQFATAWGLCLLTCIVAFPLCPALGAYGHLHIDPSVVPDVLCHTAWHYPVTLQNFRNGTFHVLDVNAFEGIVSMPSFHACASVLLAWGFSRVPILSWVMAALNMLMWVSAVPIGGHYVVDVIAGTAVALCAIFVSVRLVPRSSPAKQYTLPSLKSFGPFCLELAQR